MDYEKLEIRTKLKKTFLVNRRIEMQRNW